MYFNIERKSTKFLVKRRENSHPDILGLFEQHPRF